MQPFDYASLDAVLPHVPAVVEVAANNGSFTAIAPPGAMPANAAQYLLQVEPVAVAYQLRFGSETTGVAFQANTPFTLPYPVPRGSLAQGKLASGSATVRCLVVWPDR